MPGRASLRYDVLPRQSHDFRVAIDPPRAPGTYLLEVGLVSEGVAWFSDRGTANVQITVNIDAVSGGQRMIWPPTGKAVLFANIRR